MKSVRGLFIISLLILIVLVTAVPVLANKNQQSAVGGYEFQPSSYCLGCHTSGDSRLEMATVWIGDIDREAISPCPAGTRIHEELYYTERLMLAIDRARSELPGNVDSAKIDARVAAAQQTYSRLLDSPVSNLDAFVSEAQVLRFRLGKSYTQINQIHDALKRQNILIYSSLATLVLLISLGWGFRNAQRAIHSSQNEKRKAWSAFSPARLVFVLVIFVFFSLPIFRLPSQEVVNPSAEEQARQAALDTAQRMAGTADRALARAWMLVRVGAAWNGIDPQKAASALSDALVAAQEAQMDASALWGEAQTAQESAVGEFAAQDKAGLIAGQLDAARSRAWGLRMIAEEWIPIDPVRAEGVLEGALAAIKNSTGIYHDLDLRAIAVTWAAIDLDKGLAIASQVGDPALRAWALREIASITGEASLFDQAAEAARNVADPIQRSRTLREIAVESGNGTLFSEALEILDGVEGVAQAYALSGLAAASGDAAIANQIDPAYPAARAAALYRLGHFEDAWAAAAEITDTYEKARSQATIAAAWGNAEAAQQIVIPLLRDLALRDISIALRDVSLASSIQVAYYKVQALTALGQYQAALDEADALSDYYPLVELAVALAETDPQAALGVVEQMDREADKAEALRAIAIATGDQELFDRALGMALAARVRGDAIAPVEASLALGDAFHASDEVKAEAAYAQAFEVAERITIKLK